MIEMTFVKYLELHESNVLQQKALYPDLPNNNLLAMSNKSYIWYNKSI